MRIARALLLIPFILACVLVVFLCLVLAVFAWVLNKMAVFLEAWAFYVYDQKMGLLAKMQKKFGTFM